jgi:chaperonin GroES
MKSSNTKKAAPGIVPLGDRLILEPAVEKSAKTDSGIYIPETVKEDRGAKRATVVAVGPGRIEDGKRVPVDLTPGDTVLYQWGETVTVDGVEYVIVRESEIIAKIS